MRTLIQKFVLIQILLLFSFFKAHTQSDFRSGFVITLKGDTIKGLINAGNKKANSRICTFKRDKDQKKIDYTPEQILAYQFDNGKYYISNRLFNYEFKSPAFLEYLIRGPVSIYYLKDNKRERYFVTKDTIIFELDHYTDTIVTAEGMYLKKSQNYKGQLKGLMIDQPELFKEIDKITCNTKSLVSIAKQYQKLCCPAQEYIAYEKKSTKDLSLKLGFIGATGISHLSSPPYNMYTSDYNVTKSLDFKPALVYELGMSLNLYLNFIDENKYCIQLSPTINHVEDYKSYMEHTIYPMVYAYKANVNFTTLKIPLAFKYSFYSSNWNVLPFVKLGLGCALYLSQSGLYSYGSAMNEQPELTYNKSLTTDHVEKFLRPYYTTGLGTDIKCGKGSLSIGANFDFGYSQLDGFRTDGMIQIGYQF